MSRMQYELFVILFCLVKFILSKNYDIVVERAICEPSPKDLCINSSCTVRLVKRDVTYISTECYLPELVDNIMIRATMYYKFNEYRKFLIDVEENICDFLNNKTPTQILKIVAPSVLTAINIKSCPVKGNVRVKDLNVNSELNPAGLPAGRYRIDVTFTADGRRLSKGQIYIAVKPRGAAKLEMG